MKFIKKALCLILVLVLALSLSVSAYAAECRLSRTSDARKRSSAPISAGTNGGTPTSTRLTAERSVRLPVPTAERHSRSMAVRHGNIAATNATSSIGSEVAAMSEKQMHDEKLYQATMSMARRMLAEGLISQEEYRQIDTIFLEKYHPVFGTLLSDISLTFGA